MWPGAFFLYRNYCIMATKGTEGETRDDRLSKKEGLWLTVVGILAIVGAFVLLIWCIKWLKMWPVWVLYFIGVAFFAFRIKQSFAQKDYNYAWKCIWGVVIAGLILLVIDWIF